MSRSKLVQGFRRAVRLEFWLSTGAVVLLVAGAFVLAFHFVKPAPPTSLVLAVPGDEGGFRYFARRYQAFIEQHGVTLEIRESAGPEDNLRLLAEPGSDVDAAFVHGDTAGGEGAVSLGSVAYLPLWVFYRGEPVEDFAGLRGRRLAVGEEGSGARVLATRLLQAAGVEGEVELLALERREAMAQLGEGKIDALVMISPADSPIVRRLAALPEVNLLSLSRADAYVRRFPELSKRVLPRGALDLAADLPREDVALLSPAARLAAREELHPALTYLLLRAASETHSRPGLLHDTNDFPAPHLDGLPLSDEARRYYRSGTPLLQRYLPFWAANLVDRLWVMLVPLLAVVIPLTRVLPPLYRWRVRSRIYRWYGRLKEVELQLEENPPRETLEKMLLRMEEIEEAVGQIRTPLAYSDQLYFFRQHVELVRGKILRRLDDASESTMLESAAPAPTTPEWPGTTA